jgi:hypothetical protein
MKEIESKLLNDARVDLLKENYNLFYEILHQKY